LGKDLARQATQGFALIEAELARLDVHDAEGAERISLIGDQRHAAIEAALRAADDQWVEVKTRVLGHIRHRKQVSATDRSRAHDCVARASASAAGKPYDALIHR
jgi:6-phosphofructokinase